MNKSEGLYRFCWEFGRERHAPRGSCGFRRSSAAKGTHPSVPAGRMIRALDSGGSAPGSSAVEGTHPWAAAGYRLSSAATGTHPSVPCGTFDKSDDSTGSASGSSAATGTHPWAAAGYRRSSAATGTHPSVPRGTGRSESAFGGRPRQAAPKGFGYRRRKESKCTWRYAAEDEAIEGGCGKPRFGAYFARYVYKHYI